ncbi:putative mucin/carbohydrate-binding domain-containing protein, partial [Bacillus mycoides]|uniref:putative mucin/carbohydrate-binding domain-containing protein n=2 Tax=Bacillus TaxID=1386 RepID=UPI0036489C18
MKILKVKNTGSVETSLNKEIEKMQIQLEAGIPHSYFNSTYASIKVQNSSGSV